MDKCLPYLKNPHRIGESQPVKAKDLKRLSRSDLLEMLLDLSKENDTLRKENKQLHQQLNDRNISLENCGSLAEAALKLNGVFEAAEAACEQYLQNIQSRNADLEQQYQQIEQRCREMEQEAQKQCDEMLAKARREARACLEAAKQTRSRQNEAYAWLTELMDNGEAE